MRFIIPALVLGSLLLYFLFTGGDETSEIESVFDEIITSARDKDKEGMLNRFSIHYEDEYGYNYLVIKKVIENALQEYEDLDGSYENISVNLKEDERGDKIAYARVGAKATALKGGIPKTLIGSENSYDDIVVTLKKSALGGWKIINIEGIDKYGDSAAY